MQAPTFIKCLQAEPILFVQVLLHKRLVVSILVPSPKPLRLPGHNSTILIPHPHSKVVQCTNTSLETFIFNLLLVVYLRQEDRVLVELIEPEIGSEVVGGGKPVLNPHQLRQIAESVVDERAIPFVALLVNTDATMG